MKPTWLAVAVLFMGCGKEEKALCSGVSCQDSGFDTQGDVAVDMRVSDVEVADILPDVAGDVAVGAWQPFITETRCKIQYAFRPKEPVGLTWLPCKSGRAGCEVVDISYDVSSDKQVALAARHREPSRTRDGKITLNIAKGLDPWNKVASRFEHILFDVVDNTVLFATREENCGSIIDGDGDTFSIYAQTSTQALLVPSFRPATDTTLTPRAVTERGFSAMSRGVDDIVLSREPIAFVTNAALLPEAKRCGGIESETHLAGDVFLSTRYVADVLSLVEVKCPATVAVDAPNTGKTLIGYAVDRTENTLAWVEGTRDATGKIINKELWAAPILATTVDRDKKRKVANVSSVMSYMAAGFGRVLLAADTTKAQLVRLSDGKILEFDAESDFWFSTPLVVEKDRIWLSTGGADSRGPFFSGAVRMKYEFK